VRSLFTAARNGSDLVSSGDQLPGNLSSLLSDSLENIDRGELRMAAVQLRFDDHGGHPFVAAWHVAAREDNGRPAIVGVVADPVLITDVFARIVKESALLPPTLAADSRDLLAVRVSAPDGHRIFASSPAWSEYMSHATLDHQLGDFQIQVALSSTAADRLVIGGLPRNRVPVLIGLLVVTTGLMAIAFVQFRRERELVRLRADFISGVSHELRTPLAQIRMFGETLLLNRVRSPAERHRSLAIIVQESQRLTQLIENVLQFARVDRGAASVTTKIERLDVLLADIVDAFQPLARSRRASVERHLERIVAPVDAGALRQIVLNLLDNALKYGPPGQTIVVTCRCDGEMAAIAIEDEGPGVPDTNASRIWDPFYRVARDGSGAGGSGIGLTIVKQLAEKHGGRVRLERGSRGARFVVELPGARRAQPVDAGHLASAGA
jgi:signal transduction histidine kinase